MYTETKRQSSECSDIGATSRVKHKVRVVVVVCWKGIYTDTPMAGQLDHDFDFLLVPVKDEEKQSVLHVTRYERRRIIEIPLRHTSNGRRPIDIDATDLCNN